DAELALGSSGPQILAAEFENDPLLRMFKRANKITIVHIKPTNNRLAEQKSHRVQQRRQHRKQSESSLRTALARGMSLRFDRPRTRLSRLVAIREEAWEARRRSSPRCKELAESLYPIWEDYLHQMICHGRPITELFVGPDPTSRPGEVRWVPAKATPG